MKPLLNLATDETRMKHGIRGERGADFIRVRSVFHPWLKVRWPSLSAAGNTLQPGLNPNRP